ncbi:MAG: SBBP repeat-containing protein [Planctomycetia bacterium]|uniref:Uncharacterized protein n=2 Tax=Kuenenia stuttgartiensis TaxID=174633 RepID=A0A2C9CLA8_KUEST|nr:MULTISPECIES: SBBP repeat-containing protein [Kuenenia]MBE7549095.1 SBBP repeat-containing protein [Planctomycetia bacterium]MCZ7621947.1 SBBP repeat-containing protein [Candidatus Kuenenia sp.]SOH06373.1 hypothetical protein KSMBR1_3901 [Candidatus Kuenenia stuttgartiensis]
MPIFTSCNGYYRDIHKDTATILLVLYNTMLFVVAPIAKILKDINNGDQVTNLLPPEPSKSVHPERRHHKFIYGFTVASYEKSSPLVIDPILEYSTYLGGGDTDHGYGIAVDGAGSAYVTGYTEGNGLPIVGTTTPHGGSYDAFVTKLGTSGSSIEYSTYLQNS